MSYAFGIMKRLLTLLILMLLASLLGSSYVSAKDTPANALLILA